MHITSNLGRHLANSSIWSLFGQIVSTLTTLLFFAVLTRTLSPSDIGNFMLLMNVVMLASLVGMFGLQTTMVRSIAADFGAKKPVAVAATVVSGNAVVLFLSLIVGIVLGSPAGAAVLLNIFDIAASKALILLTGCWLVFNCCHGAITQSLRGFHDIKYATIYGAAAKNTLMVVLLIVSLGVFGLLSLEIVIAAINISLFVATLLAVRQLNTHLRSLGVSGNLSPKSASSLIRQSTPIFFVDLAYTLFVRAGIFVLGYFVAKDEVALYGAALQLVVLIVIPLRIVDSILPPIISNMYFNEINHAKLEETIRSVTTIAALPALLAIIVIVVFGDEILILTYGEFYTAGHLLLSFLAIGALSNVVLGPVGFLLTMTKNQKVLLKIQTTSLVLLLILSVAAAKVWGTIGVALVVGLLVCIQNIVMLLVARKITGILCCMYIAPKELIRVSLGIKNLTSSLLRTMQ